MQPDEVGRSLYDIFFFSPLGWAGLQRDGYRKTAGAMFKSLWGRSDVKRLWYVQTDRRWGLQVRRQRVDEKVEVIGLPIGLPYERFAPVRAINRATQARLLIKVARLNDESLETPIYWFYDWLAIELVRRLPKALTVMEVTDSAEQSLCGEQSGI